MAFLHRPASFTLATDAAWGLPVLAHEVSKHAWGLRLRRVRVGLALSSFTLLPSAPENSVGTPDGEGFRSSISCLLVPCQPFTGSLAMTNA